MLKNTEKIAGILEVEEGDVRNESETSSSESIVSDPVREILDFANNGMVPELTSHSKFKELSRQSKLNLFWRSLNALADIKERQAGDAAKGGSGSWESFVGLNEDALSLRRLAKIVAAKSIGNVPMKLDRKAGKKIEF